MSAQDRIHQTIPHPTSGGIGSPGMAGGVAMPGMNANGLPGMNANGMSVTGRMMKDKIPRMGSMSQTVSANPEMRTLMNVSPLTKMQDMMPDFMKDPGRFTQLDMRFVHDRETNESREHRRDLDDDERRRFLPLILNARGIDIIKLQFLFGLGFFDNDEVSECVLYPNAPGIWELATNGCWFQVTMEEERLIEQIARMRGDIVRAVIVQ